MAISRSLQYEFDQANRLIGSHLFGVQRDRGSIMTGELLDNIENDPHIRSVFSKRVLGVVNKDVEAVSRRELIARMRSEPPPKLTYAERKGRDIVPEVLSYSNFAEARGWWARSRLSGVSVVNLYWIVRDGLIVPWFRQVPYDWCGFRLDRNGDSGDVSTFGKYIITNGFLGSNKPFPKKTAIAISYGSNSGNPWGWGLGETLFWLKEIRSEMLKFGLVFADRHASPITVTETSGDLNQSPEDKAALEDWLQNITQEAWANLPPGVQAKVLQGSTQGADVYRSAYDSMGAEISRLVLGETGTSDQTGAGGSRARDEVASAQQLELLKADARQIDSILSETLSHWIVELNAPDAIAPVFQTVWPTNKTEELANEKTSAETLSLQIQNYKNLRDEGLEPEGGLDTYFEGWVAPQSSAEEEEAQRALNGAQLQSLTTTVAQIAAGEIPVETGVQLIVVAFPAITEDKARAMLAPVAEKLAKQLNKDNEATDWGAMLGEGDGEQPEEFAVIPTADRYTTIDTAPPEAVKQTVRRAIVVWRQKRYRDRASDAHLQIGRHILFGSLSPDDVRSLADWFVANENSKQTKAWQQQGKSWQAWQLHGGDTGRDWAVSLSRQLDNVDIGSAEAEFVAELEFKSKSKNKPKCQKGFNCGGSCINRNYNCRKALKGEAKNYADWLAKKGTPESTASPSSPPPSAEPVAPPPSEPVAPKAPPEPVAAEPAEPVAPKTTPEQDQLIAAAKDNKYAEGLDPLDEKTFYAEQARRVFDQDIKPKMEKAFKKELGQLERDIADIDKKKESGQLEADFEKQNRFLRIQAMDAEIDGGPGSGQRFKEELERRSGLSPDEMANYEKRKRTDELVKQIDEKYLTRNTYANRMADSASIERADLQKQQNDFDKLKADMDSQGADWRPSDISWEDEFDLSDPKQLTVVKREILREANPSFEYEDVVNQKKDAITKEIRDHLFNNLNL